MPGVDRNKLMGGKSDIAETGLRGFLKWLQREQPSVYMQIAPQLSRRYPQGFSDYNQSRIQALRAASGNLSMRSTLGGFGQNTNVMTDAAALNVMPPDIAAISAFTPETVNVDTSALTLPTIAVTTDTADAANASGGLDTSATDWISKAVTALTGGLLAKQQLSTMQQVTNLQLQRAQAGLPPLNIDMTKLGVPSVNVGLSAGTQSLVTYGVIGIGLALLLGLLGGRRRAA